MILSLALALAQAADPCAHDRAALLALPYMAFNQDLSGGWRVLGNRGCSAEAADLIRDYRKATRSVEPTLFWHEGQMRADIGQTAAAIALFKRARLPAGQDFTGWNLYADGTLAFMRGDRTSLDTARARLAALPMPIGLRIRGPGGEPRSLPWPFNLRVLDGLVRCWGQSYKAAYRCPIPTTSLG